MFADPCRDSRPSCVGDRFPIPSAARFCLGDLPPAERDGLGRLGDGPEAGSVSDLAEQDLFRDDRDPVEVGDASASERYCGGAGRSQTETDLRPLSRA